MPHQGVTKDFAMSYRASLTWGLILCVAVTTAALSTSMLAAANDGANGQSGERVVWGTIVTAADDSLTVQPKPPTRRVSRRSARRGAATAAVCCCEGRVSVGDGARREESVSSRWLVVGGGCGPCRASVQLRSMSSSEQFRPTRGESGCYVLDTALPCRWYLAPTTSTVYVQQAKGAASGRGGRWRCGCAAGKQGSRLARAGLFVC